MKVTSTGSLLCVHSQSNAKHVNDRWMVTYPRGLLAWIHRFGGWVRVDASTKKAS